MSADISVVIPTLPGWLRSTWNVLMDVGEQVGLEDKIIDIIVCFDGKPTSREWDLWAKMRDLYEALPSPLGKKSLRFLYSPKSSWSHGMDSRDQGTQHAKGKYICYLDDDDQVLTNHLNGLYTFAQAVGISRALMLVPKTGEVVGVRRLQRGQVSSQTFMVRTDVAKSCRWNRWPEEEGHALQPGEDQYASDWFFAQECWTKLVGDQDIYIPTSPRITIVKDVYRRMRGEYPELR